MAIDLFEPNSLGGVTLKNRFVRSATWEGMADDDGFCCEKLADVICELAQGEVGLILSSHAFVSPEGRAGPWQLAACDDRFVPGMRRMADAAHGAGGKIALQLAHAGLQAATALTGREALGPSSLITEEGPRGRQMTPAEIRQTIDSFVAAAQRAREAGFDGVQIHAAHGYLLSQFLSPYFNTREDGYGGSVEKRARIVLTILEGIKAACGSTFPVLIKMNSEDFIDGGLTVEEMLQTAEMLEHAGIDGIELSGGTTDAASQHKPVRRGKAPSEQQEGYYREAAKQTKKRIQAPLILVGGIRSYAVAKELVATGVADYVSMSRPFIREPRLIARWKRGDTEKSACQSCNLCFRPIMEGEGMYCVAQRKEREKESRGDGR